MANPAFDLIGLTKLRNDSEFADIDGSGLSVAVIDTGLDRTHPLLEPNYITGVDFVNGGDNPVDSEGHGTHVSGIVGAKDGDIGVAPDVGLIGLQVFEQNGGAYDTTIEKALQWVLENRDENKIVAVNMSLGSGFYNSDTQQFSSIYADEIQQLENAGVTVVSAGGNSFAENQTQNFASPGIISTLAVGAVWQDGVNSSISWGGGSTDYTTGRDRLTSFSQRLNAPNTIFAPGALVTSTYPGGGFEQMAGTSQASPIVAGAVALMQEAALKYGGTLLSPQEVVEIMRNSADTITDGDDENDNVENTGVDYPRLNVYQAITAIRDKYNLIAPPPDDGQAGDPNGTIQGAYLGPSLDGSPVSPVLGSIGSDGGNTNIGDRDVDIIKFELLSPGSVNLSLGSNPDNPQDFNSLLRLFNESGEQLAFDDNSGQGDFSNLTLSLNAGTYYAGISGAANDEYNPKEPGSGVSAATGNYSLNLSLSNDDPNGLINGASAISLETENQGKPVAIPGLIGTDYGTPVGVADVDLFKIVIPDNGQLFIDIDTPFENEVADTFLRVFDESGNQVFFDSGNPVISDNNLAFNAVGDTTEFTDSFYPGLVFDDSSREFYSGHTTDSFIGSTVSKGNVYYIGVSDSFNQEYNPTNLDNRPSLGAGGQYDLNVSFLNNDLNGSISQAIDTVGLPLLNQRGLIGSDGNPGTGELQEVGDRDVDFFKINSPKKGILELKVNSIKNDSISDVVDTVLCVFDQNGSRLAVNDNSDTSLDPLLRFPIEAEQNYYVSVNGIGNEGFNPFQLGSGSPGDTGEYVLNAKLLSRNTTKKLADDSSRNKGVEKVEVGSVIYANVGEDDGLIRGKADIDIYSFTPKKSGKVQIRTTTNNPYSADTFLRVFNKRGKELAFNDDANSNTQGSFLEVKVKANRQYFIGVNGWSESAGDYNPISGKGAADALQTGFYTLEIGGDS